MKPQNFQLKNEKIRRAFEELKAKKPIARRLNLSWSNWGFGLEPLEQSCARLAKAGIKYIELHGNHYGADLGYDPEATTRTLKAHGLQVGGICGMFSAENDMSSNRPHQRQAAIDYLKREVPFAAAVGAHYILVIPTAVGRPTKYDDSEWERGVDCMRRVADLFVRHKVAAAVEPIRAAEVSFLHTVADAKRFIADVNHPGVQHINGDLYHMQSGEAHIGEAILDAGERLKNLHLADSNRCALGEGSLDIDTVIMALYLVGYNTEGKFVTPEPLGPGGDPYPAMHGKPDPKVLDKLVTQTATYFREREDALLG
ncbi:MAG TPA: sugar phosphate isomerase/epimerase [Anaeromyxobacter sp.]|nr:sugar phosphate isomerase/epimerase [Anaeromyxobacter sp.]